MLQETAFVIESIIAEFRGAAGLDIDGIHLFKSTEAVDAHWATASKHLNCMQVVDVFAVTVCHYKTSQTCMAKFQRTPE